MVTKMVHVSLEISQRSARKLKKNDSSEQAQCTEDVQMLKYSTCEDAESQTPEKDVLSKCRTTT